MKSAALSYVTPARRRPPPSAPKQAARLPPKSRPEPPVDREGLRTFLADHVLHVHQVGRVGELCDATGSSLTFVGYFTDLHLDPLDQPDPATGDIWHATLTQQECEFIYALCVVGGFLIVNP